ncbi:hypothetical protein C1H46_044255 [Malus baccata]|uniref:UBL3-like ubiquitin domain-containing protein n=1 Tax=Malus baccata TaxID=106549 RepID=A0A540K7P1_MALBA|nr:hypothetical protein C1H46_044255 [Malus baccata]
MPEEDLVDIKFRLYDGTDIGPFSYSSASTVDMLKQRVVSDWPKGFLFATFFLQLNFHVILFAMKFLRFNWVHKIPNL